jgi:hypothetical protein
MYCYPAEYVKVDVHILLYLHSCNILLYLHSCIVGGVLPSRISHGNRFVLVLLTVTDLDIITD